MKTIFLKTMMPFLAEMSRITYTPNYGPWVKSLPTPLRAAGRGEKGGKGCSFPGRGGFPCRASFEGREAGRRERSLSTHAGGGGGGGGGGEEREPITVNTNMQNEKGEGG